MPKSVRPVRLAEAIAERIQTLILEGVLKPGEKLVAERDLAERLRVSRPSLREGLALLEDKGLLVTTKSGTLVARFLDRYADPLATLLADNERAAMDYFEYRLLIEPRTTAMAAQRATDLDRTAIRACLDRMSLVHEEEDPTEEAGADAQLHALIHEASHNVVVLHVTTVLAELWRRNIFYSREQLYRRAGVRESLLAQHVAIGEAIIATDPVKAERAAAEHIEFTQKTINELRLEELRIATSLRRIDRIDIVQAAPSAERQPRPIRT